jgi:hypothetical protein
MAGKSEISRFVDQMSSLNKNLQKLTKSVKSQDDILTKSGKTYMSTRKEVDKITVRYDDIKRKQTDIEKSSRLWHKALQGVGGLFRTILGAAGIAGVVASLFDIVKTTFELDTNMKNLSFRMGYAGKNAQALKQTVFDIAHETGIATEAAGELVANLARLRVPQKDLRQLAIDAARFSEVTGVSADEAGRLAGDLMRVGRMGRQATTTILAGMVKVQRAIGMSEASMSQLTETILHSTKILNQMGKSSAFIEKFNKGVTKLAGAFEQVGLSAQDANEFVQQLLDPGRVEENALLYAKLGVSMQDALTGNVDPGELVGKFKNLGQELKGMSNIAANELAKSLNMPLGQLRQMAEMDETQLSKALGVATDASGELAKANKEQLSAQDKLKKTWERVQNILVDIFDSFMPFIDALATTIHDLVKSGGGGIKSFVDSLKANIPKIVEGFKTFFKETFPKMKTLFEQLGKVFKSLFNPVTLLAILGGLIIAFMIIKKKIVHGSKQMGTEIGTEMGKGVEAALAMSAERSKKIMQQKMSGAGAGGAATGTKQARIEMTTAYKMTQLTADRFDQMAKSNLFPFAQKLAANTAAWVRAASEGVKPFSKIEYATMQIDKKNLDIIRSAREQRIIVSATAQEQKNAIDAVMKKESDRLVFVNEALKNEKDKRSANYKALEYEFKKLSANEIRANKEKSAIENAASKERTFLRNQEARHMLALSDSARIKIAEEIQGRRDIAAAGIKSSIEMYKAQTPLFTAARRELDTIKDKLSKGEITIAQYNRQKASIDEVLAKQIEMKNEIKKQITDERKLADEQAKYGFATKRSLEEAKKGDAIYKTLGARVRELTSSVALGFGNAVIDTAHKIKASFSAAFEAIGKKIQTTGANIKRLGDGSMVKGLFASAKIGLFGGFKGEGGVAYTKKQVNLMPEEKRKELGIQKQTGAMQKLGGALGKVGLIAGGMFMLLKKFPEVQEAINNIMTSLMTALKPVLKTILPIFVKIFSTLIKAIVPLVYMLLPPLLRILSVIPWIIGNLIKAISGLAKVFSKEVGESLESLGQGLIDMADGMNQAANEIDKLAAEERRMRSTVEAQNRLVEAASEEGLSDNVSMRASHTKLRFALDDLRGEFVKANMKKDAENLQKAMELVTARGVNFEQAVRSMGNFSKEQAVELKNISKLSKDQQQAQLQQFLEKKSKDDFDAKIQKEYGKTYNEMMDMSEKQLAELIKNRKTNEEGFDKVAASNEVTREIRAAEILAGAGGTLTQLKGMTEVTSGGGGTPTVTPSAVSTNTGNTEVIKGQEKGKAEVETAKKLEENTGITAQMMSDLKTSINDLKVSFSKAVDALGRISVNTGK